MNCPKCGAPLRENALFCTACGTRVAETPQQPSRLKSTMPLDGQSAPKAEAPAPRSRSRRRSDLRLPRPLPPRRS